MHDSCPYARRILEIGRGGEFSTLEKNELQEHLRGACAGCAVIKRDPERGPTYDRGRLALVVDAAADADVEPLVQRISSRPPPPPEQMDDLFRRTLEAIARKKAET